MNLIPDNPSTRKTNSFFSSRIYIYTSPGELYTPYEKLLLPFDDFTWILLAITFFLTIAIIFILKQLSLSTQYLIYGEKIETPIWNVVSIFFGISQTKLPAENISRFILTFFIVFCLIFRTCYQSKLFEFMTSNPARSPPKTIQDLITMNYTLLLREKYLLSLMVFEDKELW